jgi:hypothetical protein
LGLSSTIIAGGRRGFQARVDRYGRALHDVDGQCIEFCVCGVWLHDGVVANITSSARQNVASDVLTRSSVSRYGVALTTVPSSTLMAIEMALMLHQPLIRNGADCRSCRSGAFR